jgi:hypothetical protein
MGNEPDIIAATLILQTFGLVKIPGRPDPSPDSSGLQSGFTSPDMAEDVPVSSSTDKQPSAFRSALPSL